MSISRRFPVARLLPALWLLSGCGTHPAAPLDAAVGGGDEVDLAGVTTPPPDAAAVDAAAASPPDLSPTDLAQPSHEAPGLVWPPSQTFPSFQPIGPLDVVDVTALAHDQQTLFVTLAGLVNRTKPRIYTLDGGGEGTRFWLDKLGVPSTVVADPFALVAKYHDEVAGLVVYDPALGDTINLATTIAGVRNGVVVSPDLAAKLGAAPYHLPLLIDLRDNHFASKVAVYQYELDHYLAGATHRLICGLDPAIAGHLRDYAVATRSPMVWLDPAKADEKALLLQFFGALDHVSPYLGWWPDEGVGVGAAAAAGIPVFAADWASNLSVFGGTPRGIHVPARPARPTLANKIYVALIMSDGDNLQENQHLIPMKWADANRGKVPIGWTTTPSLVDAAPLILNYYWSTATANDVMISGPSGLGYTYPEWWATDIFDAYAARSGAYLDAAGLRAITIWNKDPNYTSNDGKDLSAANATSYASKMPHLLGLTMQGGYLPLLHQWSVLDGKLPLVYLAQTYGNNEADLESGIDNAVRLWNHGAPNFVAVQGNMNSGDITATTFYNVQQHYASNSDYVFVRVDHFFQLLRESKGLPLDP